MGLILFKVFSFLKETFNYLQLLFASSLRIRYTCIHLITIGLHIQRPATCINVHVLFHTFFHNLITFWVWTDLTQQVLVRNLLICYCYF